MSNHKATVVFAEKVWDIIEWFTYNFDTEIGALGIVKQKKFESGEKYFYVEELLFPKQKVSGATVHFTPEGWSELIKERGLDGLKNVAFYWHRHPGSSSHSCTDDEDTFETFMSIEAQRKYFIFLQTAVGSTGWNQEARIDIRLPGRHTILNRDIDVEVEEKPEDLELKKECEAIAKKCIIKEKPLSTTYNNLNRGSYYNNGGYQYGRGSYQQKLTQENKDAAYWNKYATTVKLNGYSSLETAICSGRFGKIEGTDYMDNDILNGVGTIPDEKVSITFENGQATVIAGKKFGLILEKVLAKKEDGKLSQFVRQHKTEKSNTKGLKKYNLQPVSGKYMEMKTTLTKGYLIFCERLLVEIDKELRMGNTEPTETSAIKKLFEGEYVNKYSDNDIPKEDDPNYNKITIEGIDEVINALDILEAMSLVVWDGIHLATITDIDTGMNIGNIWQNDACDKIIIEGEEPILLLEEAKAELLYGSDAQDEREEEEQ